MSKLLESWNYIVLVMSSTFGAIRNLYFNFISWTGRANTQPNVTCKLRTSERKWLRPVSTEHAAFVKFLRFYLFVSSVFRSSSVLVYQHFLRAHSFLFLGRLAAIAIVFSIQTDVCVSLFTLIHHSVILFAFLHVPFRVHLLHHAPPAADSYKLC